MGQVPTRTMPPSPTVAISPKATSQRCVQPASMVNGARLVLANCDGSAGQQWLVANDRVQLANGKCLDMTDGNANNGVQPQIWDCASNNANQSWTLTAGTIRLDNTNLCLDLTDGNTSAGNTLQVWTCADGNQNQLWNTPSSATPAPTPTPAAVSQPRAHTQPDARPDSRWRDAQSSRPRSGLAEQRRSDHPSGAAG